MFLQDDQQISNEADSDVDDEEMMKHDKLLAQVFKLKVISFYFFVRVSL